MVRPDQERLWLEIGAKMKIGLDHGQEISIGLGVVLLGWDEVCLF